MTDHSLDSTMKEMEIKECPFCGGKAEMKYMGDRRWHIQCTNCPARLGSTWGRDETPDYLIAAWNQRKGDE